jgi:hypothetical protein
MAGWVKVHRDITKHYLWDDKPYSKGQAWIDILLMVNHSDNKTMIGNEVILVDRGSRITSEVKLSKRWGWGRKKVRSFLKALEHDNMLTKKSTTKYTMLTVVNWALHQDKVTTEEHQKNNEGTTKEHQGNTNKNVKKVKNEKKSTYGAYKNIKLKKVEYDKLQDEFGNADELIEHLDQYIEMKGTKYKSHYMVIRNWVVKAVQEKKQKQSAQVSMYPDLTGAGGGEW